MSTIKNQIIEAFTERAAALSALPVGRVSKTEKDIKNPVMSVYDTGMDIVQEAGNDYTQRRCQIRLIAVFEAVGENASFAANELAGEIIKTIMTGVNGFDNTFNGLANATTEPDVQIDYPETGKNKITIICQFPILYTVKTGDPYSLPFS